MAKTSPKLTRAAVIAELESLIAAGRALAAREIADVEPLAVALVERLEWQGRAGTVLRHLPRGNVQVYADFTRAGNAAQLVFFGTIAAEVAHFREVLGTQIDVLEAATTKLRSARTKPLTTP